MTELTEEIRGQLLGAARAAAVTAVSSGIDSLNTRLRQRGAGSEAEEELEEVDESDSKVDEEEYPDEPPEDDNEPAEDELADEYPDEDEEDTTEEDTEAAKSRDDSEEEISRPSRTRRTATSHVEPGLALGQRRPLLQ